MTNYWQITRFRGLFKVNRHDLVVRLKTLIYGRFGEPYRIGGKTLRYIPGTRPVRLKYCNSSNDNNRYDALQVKLFSEAIKEGDFCVDVGAHAGQYAILMAAFAGQSGRIVAFEPDPYARVKFLRNLELNPGLTTVDIEPIALSDTGGSATLFSMQGNSQSSLAMTGIGEVNAFKAEQIEVVTQTLDEFLEKRKLSPPDWLKIDAEGAEIKILAGAAGVLASDTKIVCELHPYAWGEFGDSFADLLDLVRGARRSIRYLDEADSPIKDPKYGLVLID